MHNSLPPLFPSFLPLPLPLSTHTQTLSLTHTHTHNHSHIHSPSRSPSFLVHDQFLQLVWLEGVSSLQSVQFPVQRGVGVAHRHGRGLSRQKHRLEREREKRNPQLPTNPSDIVNTFVNKKTFFELSEHFVYTCTVLIFMTISYICTLGSIERFSPKWWIHCSI